MKRVTLLMNDDMYTSLLDYASVRSRSEIRIVSMGEVIREIISKESKHDKLNSNLKVLHKQDSGLPR
jgi:hypothetical protein